MVKKFEDMLTPFNAVHGRDRLSDGQCAMCRVARQKTLKIHCELKKEPFYFLHSF